MHAAWLQPRAFATKFPKLIIANFVISPRNNLEAFTYRSFSRNANHPDKGITRAHLSKLLYFLFSTPPKCFFFSNINISLIINK